MDYKPYTVDNVQAFCGYRLPLPANFLVYWDGYLLRPGFHFTIHNPGAPDQTFQLNLAVIERGLQLGAGLAPVETTPTVLVVSW
jgi:hypothetical protein